MAADEVSRTSSAYVGRSQRGQSASGQSRPSATKAYYPEQYFNRVGFAARSSTSSVPDQTRSQASRGGSRRVDALGQRVRERFNEELEYPAEEKKTPGRLCKGVLDADNQSNRDLLSKKSGGSRVQSAILSRRTGLQKRGANNSSAMRIDEDQESVITTDKLKRFNDIQGTHAGNMNEELERQEAELAEAVAMAEEADEARDEVASQLLKAPSVGGKSTFT